MPGNGFTATAISATQEDILSGMADLLRAEFSEWDTTAIYWTDNPKPEVSQNLDLFIQLTPGGGSFNQGILQGGPRAEETSLVGVTIWRRSVIDDAGRAQDSLFNTSEGLLKIKRRVLKALTGKMLVDGSGNQIATGTITPQQALEPDTGATDPPLDRLAMYFQVPFDWDLS
jgi:hypothetical protein